MRLGDDPIADTAVERPFDHGVQQGAIIQLAETSHLKLRQTRQVKLRIVLP